MGNSNATKLIMMQIEDERDDDEKKEIESFIF